MKDKIIIEENGTTYAIMGNMSLEITDITDVIIHVDSIKCNAWYPSIKYYRAGNVPLVMENIPENMAALRQFSSLKD